MNYEVLLKNINQMNYLAALLIATFSSINAVQAQSNLLESVKRNPNEAIALCSKFRSLNSQGVSASSKASITEISEKRNLSEIDAEILSMYVRGLHCPDVI